MSIRIITSEFRSEEQEVLSIFRDHFEAPRPVSEKAIDYFYKTRDTEFTVAFPLITLICWIFLGSLLILAISPNYFGLGIWFAGLLLGPASWLLAKRVQRRLIKKEISDLQIIAARVLSYSVTSSGDVVGVECRLAHNFNGEKKEVDTYFRVRKSEFGSWKVGSSLVALLDPATMEIKHVIGRPGIDASLPLAAPQMAAVHDSTQSTFAPVDVDASSVCSKTDRDIAINQLKEAFAENKIDQQLLGEKVASILNATTREEIRQSLLVHIARL